MRAINDNAELYATVRLILGALQDAGEHESSAAIDRALSFSSLPGEVLGEVRAQLLRARDLPALRTDEPRRLTEVSLAYLDRVLGPALD